MKCVIKTVAVQVQVKSAELLKQLDMVSGAIGIVANLVLGTYSDVLGRRFLMLVPIVGHFLRDVTAPIVIHWDLGLPALYSGYILDGLCGGSIGRLNRSTLFRLTGGSCVYVYVWGGGSVEVVGVG